LIAHFHRPPTALADELAEQSKSRRTRPSEELEHRYFREQAIDLQMKF